MYFCSIIIISYVAYVVCGGHQFIDDQRKLCINCPENSLATQNHTASSVQDCFCVIGYQGDPGNGLPCLGVVLLIFIVSISCQFD